MRRPAVRQVIAVAVPLMLLATMVCALVFLVAQQSLRAAANDPQLAMAEDAATALDAGANPASLVPRAGTPIDVSTSRSPFTVVFGPGQTVLATDGRLDGGPPVPPAGVIDHARDIAPVSNSVTWQPRPGLRIATVTAAWSGGTVLVGRSLRDAERRTDEVFALVGVAWIAMLVVILGASAVGVGLWHAHAAESRQA